ncbi:uncharacterized protein LOC126899679 isoform X2 [Daktulosphaira vitifoliae]|nr:uncharacterized protein LOC126899679 isoform X2 [Daktulosphaira vitifoliae]
MDSKKKFTPNFKKLLNQWNGVILQIVDENYTSKIGYSMANHICFTFITTGFNFTTDDDYDQCLIIAQSCCYSYVVNAKEIMNSIEIVKMPYDHLITAISKEKKILPKLLENDGMIMEPKDEPEEENQIVVLSKNTEDADYIKMEYYI